MENIILTNNKDLRLVSVKVGVLSTLRFELPLVSASATHVEVIVTSGNVHSAYTATFIDDTKFWQCDIAASQFPTVGRQSYEVAYVLDGKQFWDGKGWIEIEDATTSGIEPQPRPEPYRYAVVSVNGYGADAQGAVRIPKTFIATDSPVTTEGYMEGDIYFNRETGATWTLCNVQGTLTWVFNYKNYYTKTETDEAIDRVAAYYITYDAAGNPFPTYASLANAQTVYSGGSVRVPTRNDYCVVLADETHQGAEYRYIYAVAEGQTTGSWQPQFPVEGVMTVDQSVTKNSQNPVSGGGVWSALWGALSALPTGFTSLYDWCVAQIAKLRDKLDLAVYGFGNATVALSDGFSITFYDQTYTAPVGGETITFIGPVPSSNEYTPNYKFYYPSSLGTLDSFDPNNYSVWCLVCSSGGDTPDELMYKTGPSYSISGWNSTAPTLTLSNGEATGDAPTMARPLGATGDTLAKVSQIPALVAPSTSASDSGKAADAKATGDALDGKLVNSQTTPYGLATLSFITVNDEPRLRMMGAAGEYIDITFSALRFQIPGYQEFVLTLPMASGTLALTAGTGHAGNLAALDASGNPTDSGIAAGDILTIVTLADSTETMASVLARLNAINAAHKHVFFDCSGIDVNPRLYLCTIMIDADANAVRVYDQVTGKLYIGPYDAAETIGEVFAKAVDAYHSITVSAVTLDGVTVTGQTVTIREGTDATAPVYATATITDGAPVTFVVPKGMIYFLEITDTLADHFGPRVTSGSRQGIATADAAVTFTYYDAEHIDVSEITTFAKLQEALTWFGTNEAAARNNLVGIEIADTWTATNGTVYDNPRVVWDVHYFEDENGVRHLGALMGTKYCSYNDVQFDAAEGEECYSSTETVAEAGVYYYGLALGQTSKTAANLTLLELSEGAALPYADYAKIYKSAIRDTTRNSLQYGYNNWRDSAYRQYLNSDAAAGQWWGATHIGDIAPSQLNSVRGFMAGCSAALLAAAKKVKVATWPNSITDGPNQITTLYETLDTFFLPSGSEVYGDVNRSGGASVEGELSPYWQARTGYTAPNNAAISTRIVYRELPVGSTANRSAASVRLRSADRGYSSSVWYVSTSGQVSSYNASYAIAFVPACVIY